MLAAIGACSSSNAARAVLARCRSFCASRTVAIDLLNAPEMECCFEADRQRCRTEVSFFKSMAMLLAMLLPIVAHDVACRTCDDSMQHHAVFAIQCVLSSQHLLIALVHLLLLLRHKK